MKSIVRDAAATEAEGHLRRQTDARNHLVRHLCVGDREIVRRDGLWRHRSFAARQAERQPLVGRCGPVGGRREELPSMPGPRRARSGSSATVGT